LKYKYRTKSEVKSNKIEPRGKSILGQLYQFYI